jgi:hypothetical protein
VSWNASIFTSLRQRVRVGVMSTITNVFYQSQTTIYQQSDILKQFSGALG